MTKSEKFMKFERISRVTVLMGICFLTAFCISCKKKDANGEANSVKAQTQRPAAWAVPIEKAGLPNFFKVSEDLYRGAQPSEEGIVQLKQMGIKTIINLRAFHCDKDEVGDVNLVREDISVKPWHPEEEDVIEFLRIVTDKQKLPVFVHCQHGADRTGLMCAIYRMAVCGWSKESAIEEMINGGYGFHSIWKNLIDYSKNLDIENLKKQVGLAKPQENNRLAVTEK